MSCQSGCAESCGNPRPFYLCRFVFGLAVAFLWILTGPVIPGILSAAALVFSFSGYFRTLSERLGISGDEDLKDVTGSFRQSAFLITLISAFTFVYGLTGASDISVDAGPAGGFRLYEGLLFLSAASLAVTLTDFRSLSSLLSGSAVRTSPDDAKDSGSGAKVMSGRASALLTSGRFLLVILSGLAAAYLHLSPAGLSGNPADLFSGDDLTVLSQIVFFAVFLSLMMSLLEIIPAFPDRHASFFSGIFLAGLVLLLSGCVFSIGDILFALVFALSLGILSYVTRIGDLSALLGSALLGFLITLYTSPLHYVLVLMFFIIGSLCTKYKYSYKEKLGLAESRKGMRTYVNVFANSLPSLIWAVACGISVRNGNDFQATLFTFAFVGTVANALADTMASEIGMTYSGPAYLITTFRKTKTGEDGGISLPGELACLAGSAVIGLLAFCFGIIDSLPAALLAGLAGGFIGTNLDSLFGATLQKNNYLSNSGVNLLSTALSGFPAAAVSLLFI